MSRALATMIAWLALPAVVGAAGPAARPPITPEQAAFFEGRVRPVLAEHCFSCHGPKKQRSGLRLDSAEGLRKGGDGGPVVLPGDPDNSPLIRAVRQQGDRKMPPKGKLPRQAVEELAAWVKMGAPWPPEKAVAAGPKVNQARKNHWAFQPVRKPARPSVRDRAWPATPLDHFVLARLEEKGLTPSPPADRRTLVRRVTFDLTGLPPTPEEVSAFEADPSPDAFAKVVDRLLASPAYGERWARHWLDVARYADTKGYVFFQDSAYPWAYTYRDYVIRALNEDLPYDQFVLQQLAADRLPLGADRRPLTALGFLSLGGRFMNNRQDIIDDQIDVVTRGLLGLTVTCARCHDHKFDPIPQRDYYGLYGVFASTVEPPVPPLFEPPPQTAAYAAFDRELKAREKRLSDFVRAKHAQLVGGARSRVAEYLLAAQALRDQPSTEDFMLIADGNDLNPTMVLRWKVYLERTARSRDPVFAPWHAFAALPAAEFARRAAEVSARLAGRPDPARPVNPLVAEMFAGRPPGSLAEVARRYGELLNGVDKVWRQTLAARGANAVRRLPDPAEEELRQVFYGPESPPSVPVPPLGDLALLPDRPSQAKLQELVKALETWRASGPGAPPRAMVLEDAPTPYEPKVFLRGNPHNLGEAVPRRLPQVLASVSAEPFHEGSGRLELARAIADPRNPLTARVLVNRVWLHHFGAGLVRTPSDFGLRSAPPSHPDLLDWLAAAFVEDGWSVKKLHRAILLSRAYQQQSHDRPECLRVDPENRLLWKVNRQRLDFEATRDALLAVAGRLNRTVGGPSVRDITAPLATRRTLYGYLDRLNVPGLYRTFDFPSPDATSPQRDATTVAPQALFLMNNPFVIECARHLVRRPDVTGVSDVAGKVARLYRLVYGRPPSPEEMGLASEYLGTAPSPVAWERYGQALLLANEFAFID
jgi:mono/diheme cytochrome c family protein